MPPEVELRCWLGQEPSEDLTGQTSKMVSHLASLSKLLSAQQELLMEVPPRSLHIAGASPCMVAGLQEGAPKNVCSENPRQEPQNHFCHILLAKKAQIPGDWAENPPRDGRGRVTLQESMEMEGVAEAVFASCSQPHLPTDSNFSIQTKSQGPLGTKGGKSSKSPSNMNIALLVLMEEKIEA